MGSSAKLTSKGQITLPAEMRRELGLKTGDTVNFSRNEKGRFEIVGRGLALEEIRGIIPYDGPALSDEALTKMVEEARTERAETIANRLKAGRRR